MLGFAKTLYPTYEDEAGRVFALNHCLLVERISDKDVILLAATNVMKRPCECLGFNK